MPPVEIGLALEEAEIVEIGDEAGADVLERLGERTDELAEQHVAGEAAEDQHAAERHDERGDLAERDEIALRGADQAAEDERDRNDDLPGNLDVDVEQRRMKSDHQGGGDRADKADDRPDGEIDIAADDDQEHAERHDDDVRILQDEVRHIERGERNAVGEVVEEAHDHEQGEQEPVIAQTILPERGPRGLAGSRDRDRFVFHCTAPYCFMIEAMIFSWLASLAGISSTKRPSFIT